MVLPVETGSGTFMSRPCFALWARRVGRAWGHGWCVGYADHAPLKPARVEGYVTPPLMPLARFVNRKGKLGAYTLKGRAHQRFLRWTPPPIFEGHSLAAYPFAPKKALSIIGCNIQSERGTVSRVDIGPWASAEGLCPREQTLKPPAVGLVPQGGGRENPPIERPSYGHKIAFLWS